MNTTTFDLSHVGKLLHTYLREDESPTQVKALQDFCNILKETNEETILEVIDNFKEKKLGTDPNDFETGRRMTMIISKIIQQVKDLAIKKARMEGIDASCNFLDMMDEIFHQTAFGEMKRQMKEYPNKFLS